MLKALQTSSAVSPDSCRLDGERMERSYSLQKTLKVRLQLFIALFP